MSSILTDKAFVVGVATGAAACIGAVIILKKVYPEWSALSRTGAYANPHYGLKNVRSHGSMDPDEGVSKGPAPHAKETLPSDYLAKHPKGLGVEPKAISGREVAEVLLLPVHNLSEFYQSQNAENKLGSAVNHTYNQFTGQEDVILGDIVRKSTSGTTSRAYLRAGPRKTLYFNPKEVRAAIVTCGGLCPGLNNIIREVTKSLHNLYGVAEVWGVRGGYWGFHQSKELDPNLAPILLTHQAVSGIQHKGGTMLGSARGGFDLEEIFGFCTRHRINQLFVVGGDGTHRAANKFGLEAIARKANIAVAGIPKTIDNDLDLVDRTFGFNSAVMAAQDAINSAATEARDNLPNGIGIVKLMGRHAGFIAAHATLASGDVDLCLVPEVDVELDGKYGVLPHIERVLRTKGKCVVVVAEGAGEELCGAAAGVDAGGNKKLPEIGPFIKDAINKYFKARNTTVNVKYIDPSYMVRSVPANASDSLFCMLLAQNAVHGAMAGYTCFTTGLCCNRTVYLPIPALVENSPRKMDRAGRTWERIITVTGQPNRPVNKKVGELNDSAVQPATIF